jgi:acyl-CoA-binding protein
VADLTTQFTTATEDAKQLPERPDNATMLRLYGLYKQGSGGDVTGKRPGMMDFVARAKYDAWAELEGTPQEEAMQGYVDLVESLKAG